MGQLYISGAHAELSLALLHCSLGKRHSTTLEGSFSLLQLRRNLHPRQGDIMDFCNCLFSYVSFILFLNCRNIKKTEKYNMKFLIHYIHYY